MGLGSIAKSVGGGAFNAAKQVGSGAFGGLIGAVRGEGDGPGFGEFDPRAKEILDRQSQMARDYNVGGNIESRVAGATGDSRRNLAASMAGVRNRAQGRGQLWSGLKQQQDLGEIGAAQSDLNNQIADIRRNEYANRDALQTQALGGAMDYQSLQQQRENALYQQALDRKQNRNALMNSGVQGAFSLGGAFLGAKG